MKFTSKKALADHKALPHILLEEHGQYCWKSTPLQESQFLHGDIYEKKENEHQSCPPIRRLSVILNLEGALGSTKGVQYHDHEHHYYSSGKYEVLFYLLLSAVIIAAFCFVFVTKCNGEEVIRRCWNRSNGAGNVI